MSAFTAFLTKTLILPVLAGSFCLGMLLHVPMAQAVTPEHGLTMGTDVKTMHMSETDSTASDCCSTSHTEHKTDAVAPDAGKTPVNVHAVPCTPIVYHDQPAQTDPILFSLKNERSTKASFLTGIIIKRE